MSTYDPQKRANRPKADQDEPAPVDELLESTDGAPTAPEPVPPTPRPDASGSGAGENGGGGKGKVIGIGVAITAVLFALRWALKRRHKDDD